MTQSSVKTKTKTDVSTWTTALTYATNQTISLLMKYANQRGLDTNYLTRNRDVLEDGLYTWLCSRHLDEVYLEVYNPNTDTVEERLDIGFQHEDPSIADNETARKLQEKEFEALHSSILEQVRRSEAPPDGCRYRVVVSFRETEEGEDPPDVDGWSPTSLRSVDHLTKEDLGGWLDTGAVEGDAALWIGGNDDAEVDHE